MVNKNDNNSLKMIFIIYISNKEHTNQPNEPLSVTLKDLFFFLLLNHMHAHLLKTPIKYHSVQCNPSLKTKVHANLISSAVQVIYMDKQRKRCPKQVLKDRWFLSSEWQIDASGVQYCIRINCAVHYQHSNITGMQTG